MKLRIKKVFQKQNYNHVTKLLETKKRNANCVRISKSNLGT